MTRLVGAFALLLAFILGAAPAAAQSYYGTPSPLEGAYVGGYGGGSFDTGSSWSLGGMAGVNFEVTPGIMAGVETQGGANVNSTGTTWEGMMLARGGGGISPDAMVYGMLGAGVVNGTTSWGVGGGAEAIVAPQIGVRGEVLGTGPMGSGLNRAKVTAGLVWHMQ